MRPRVSEDIVEVVEELADRKTPIDASSLEFDDQLRAVLKEGVESHLNGRDARIVDRL